MAYGRIYIDKLRSKVTALFDELISQGKLGEANFIEAFKQKYPKDYALLQYEWEFKIHEFKKNRKGTPKTHPIRPEKILSNMYRNYYYKLIKKPAIAASKKKALNDIRSTAGNYGYKIQNAGSGKYHVVSKDDGDVLYKGITFKELKRLFSKKGVREILFPPQEIAETLQKKRDKGENNG